MESPDVPAILRLCERRGLSVPMNETSYYLGRETLLRTGQSSMARWRKSLFAFLIRNAQPATAFFRLPPNRRRARPQVELRPALPRPLSSAISPAPLAGGALLHSRHWKGGPNMRIALVKALVGGISGSRC
jgi:hypothetical protein